ncbi:translation initiation factor IF-2 [bacterium]|nr:translation initiation factor IF-2 [bacterium]
MNLTELARRLKISTKELKAKLPELGFDIGPRAIQIPDKQAEKVIEKWKEMKRIEALQKKIESRKAAEKKEIKKEEQIIFLPAVIRVHQLAEKLNLPVTKVISELMKNGVMATINDNLDYEIAAIIAENLGFKTKKAKGELEELAKANRVKEKLKKLLQEKGKLSPRPPVVVVLGHVDHGKTSLLDAIRETNITSQEAGAITQHIGAYQVDIESKEYGKKTITFIDTPGHEAFNEMRSRGGQVADIAILVIAADDKIQPQTLESIKVIQEEELPFIVAINKIDKPEANVEEIKKELADINLVPEDWGGKVICVPVSAKTKEGINNLLEMILLVANLEREKLLANFSCPAVGTIIESHIDKGQGPVATVLIHTGKLFLRDNIIVGEMPNAVYGKVKVLKNFLGKDISEASPGMPVQIIGLKALPSVGDILEVKKDLKEFKRKVKKINLQKRYSSKIIKIKKSREKENVKSLNVILKADVFGSLEAISTSLKNLSRSNVEVKIIKSALGDITESDIRLASTSHSIVIGFHVKMPSPILKLADELKVEVYLYKVIYKLLEDVEKKVKDLISKKIIEKFLGKVRVLAVFRKMSKEMIIGGKVIEGEIKVNSKIRVWRDDKPIAEGDLTQLQMNKQDVTIAKKDNECGIKFEGQPIIRVNDILEVYELVEEKVD